MATCGVCFRHCTIPEGQLGVGAVGAVEPPRAGGGLPFLWSGPSSGATGSSLLGF